MVFACSDPEGFRLIEVHTRLSYLYAVASGVLLFVSLTVYALGPRRWLVPAIALILLAAHPAWTISAIQGDCGYGKEMMARLATGIAAWAVLCQSVRSAWYNWFTESVRCLSSGASSPYS